MSSRQNRRMVSLLLLALLGPCGVLAFLSVRIIRQESELRERRRLEEEERASLELRITPRSTAEGLVVGPVVNARY